MSTKRGFPRATGTLAALEKSNREGSNKYKILFTQQRGSPSDITSEGEVEDQLTGEEPHKIEVLDWPRISSHLFTMEVYEEEKWRKYKEDHGLPDEKSSDSVYREVEKRWRQRNIWIGDSAKGSHESWKQAAGPSNQGNLGDADDLSRPKAHFEYWKKARREARAVWKYNGIRIEPSHDTPGEVWARDVSHCRGLHRSKPDAETNKAETKMAEIKEAKTEETKGCLQSGKQKDEFWFFPRASLLPYNQCGCGARALITFKDLGTSTSAASSEPRQKRTFAKD